MSSERVSGRLVLVWTEESGTTLTQDEVATATVLHVDDCSVFNDDGQGGSLRVGDQVVAYTEVDDDASTITLAAPLAADAEQDDDVIVWSTLYDEADTIQRALVDTADRDDKADLFDAAVSDELELVDGDRGRAGETCTLEREDDGDEWTVIHVSGRPRRARGVTFEADDTYTVTGAEGGAATIELTHRPVYESLTAYWNGLFQPPTEYDIDYAARQVTWPLAGSAPGDELSVHYAYRKGLTHPLHISLGHDWRYQNGLVGVGETNVTSALGAATYAAPTFNDSAWPVGPSGFGYGAVHSAYIRTTAGPQLNVWTRTTGVTHGGRLRLTMVVDWRAWLYIDGVLAWSILDGGPAERTFEIACPSGEHVFAAYGWDEPTSLTSVLAIEIEELLL